MRALTELNSEATAHRNAVWDYELAFAASRCATNAGATLRVMTGDKAIQAAAEQTGDARIAC